MYCRFCGKEVKEEDLFCSSCGRPLKEEQQKGKTMSSQPSFSNLSSPAGKKTQRNSWKMLAAGLGGICVLLVILLVFYMGKSSSSDPQQKTAALSEAGQSKDDTQENGQDTAVQADQTNQADQTDQTERQDTAGKVSQIITDYYSLTVPSSWEGKYAYKVYPPEEEWSEAYYLDVYHKESEQQNYGGSLFGISLFYDGDSSYLSYPDYEVLGRLQIKQASIFDVVVTYPTDVQFTDETEPEYTELRKDVENVLKSFEADSKYSFTPADGI